MKRLPIYWAASASLFSALVVVHANGSATVESVTVSRLDSRQFRFDDLSRHFHRGTGALESADQPVRARINRTECDPEKAELNAYSVE